jgi:signal transduction histidine kinase
MSPRPFTPNDHALGRGLVVAFVLLILCFTGSTLSALHVSNGIGAASDSIAHNAAPSVVRLASVRTELRRLEVSVDGYVGRPEALPFEAREIQRSLQALDEELERYYALPSFPGENDLWPPIEVQRKALRDAVQRTLELAPTRREEAQRLLDRFVRPTVDRLDDGLRAISQLNASRAAENAREIARLRERGRYLALRLDLLSALFGLLLLVLLVRSLRQYTRILRAQQEALEARADELDDFSSRVAHDILGPLSALALALDLADKGAHEPPTRALLARSQRSLRRVRSIVEGLYEFARSGARPLADSRSDAHAVLAELIEDLRPLADEARIELRYEPEGRGEVACSVGVLNSIVGNLTRNAIKYMGEATSRHITLRLLEAGPRLRLEVRDTGPGIPPSFQTVLFEPHARAPGVAQPGLGLGLATVKRLALAHGGAVGVQSEPGQGACFWVELPRVPPTAGPAAPR